MIWACMHCTLAMGQSNASTDLDSLYEHLSHSRFTDPSASLALIHLVQVPAQKAKDSCKLVEIHAWMSKCFDSMGVLDSALFHGQMGLLHFNKNCDSLLFMQINAVLSAALLSLEESDKVIAISNRCLSLWNSKWPKKGIYKSFYTNKAIAQVYKGDFDDGLKTFRQLLSLSKEDGSQRALMDASNNISVLFGMRYENGGDKADLDSVAKYIKIAIGVGRSLGQEEETILHYSNLASLYADLGDYKKSFKYLDTAEVLAKKSRLLPILSTLASIRSEAFEATDRLDSALFYLRQHLLFRDSLMDQEKVKAISEMREKYESEKRERQIKELEVSNLNSALREEQLTKTRNIYLFSGLGILLFAIGLWSRLVYTRKAKAIIQKEKDRSEELLLNILPEETAQELKEKGESDARLIEQVTVLFTDFKGFTALSEQVSPKQLVADLHKCFSAFDMICEQYGIEKIKTIGDAYMAAGGLPTPNVTHPEDVINAALDMAQVVQKGVADKQDIGLPYFEVRIGVHTGPVVAGIVGIKKFQYDIWGDTVNTASRMESSGEIGKVNISASTYEMLKDNPHYSFESRGKIKAKGKGAIAMYFVSRKPRVEGVA